MHGVKDTITDRNYCDALVASQVPDLARLAAEAGRVADEIRALFEVSDLVGAGTVTDEALYESLAALQFVADWAESQL